MTHWLKINFCIFLHQTSQIIDVWLFDHFDFWIQKHYVWLITKLLRNWNTKSRQSLTNYSEYSEYAEETIEKKWKIKTHLDCKIIWSTFFMIWFWNFQIPSGWGVTPSNACSGFWFVEANQISKYTFCLSTHERYCYVYFNSTSSDYTGPWLLIDMP